ncbi:hypothetical protein C2S52_007600 [Perilla frutescens var. hirtella]|nr:hypothetical protein C2S51_008289 [Perilla frutescens var. frutescens]KAH6788048.1 hypothetical protein C2S52_007600 [Perilla frutescens var. hirtella]
MTPSQFPTPDIFGSKISATSTPIEREDKTDIFKLNQNNCHISLVFLPGS